MIDSMTQPVLHPMDKFQRQVRSLVGSRKLNTTDSLWKVAFVYGDEWGYWKQELLEFGFTMKDPIQELLAVQAWDED
jgi:Domain of unknown function (DUF4327)